MADAPAASIPSLTGIRGAAALWVVLYHVQAGAKQLGLPGMYGWPGLRTGWMGVDVFFILSGFILMYAHGEGFRRITGQGLWAFAWLRAWRIYPLATVVLLLLAPVVLLNPGFADALRQAGGPDNLTPLAFIKTLLLATRWFPPFRDDWNQPVWSLSVEIIGYVAFPFIAFALVRARRIGPLILLATVSLIVRFLPTLLLDSVEPGEAFDFVILRMAGCFLAGMALCQVWRLAPQLTDRAAALGALVAVAALVALSPVTDVLLEFPLAALILFLAYQSGVVNRALSSPIAMFLGRISFPFYLLHTMPLRWLEWLVQSQQIGVVPALLALLALLAGLVGLSYLLHRVVEAPVHRWARRWLQQRSAASIRRAVVHPVQVETPN